MNKILIWVVVAKIIIFLTIILAGRYDEPCCIIQYILPEIRSI